jgi:hypothetical protein
MPDQGVEIWQLARYRSFCSFSMPRRTPYKLWFVHLAAFECCLLTTHMCVSHERGNDFYDSLKSQLRNELQLSFLSIKVAT